MDWTQQDKAQRAKLEKQSSAGTRADMVGALNRLGVDSAVVERDAVDVLTKFRARSQGLARTTADRNARHDHLLAKGAFNRLHPGALSARPADRPREVTAADSDDARDQPYVTPIAEGRTYDRVGDANGSMRADARTRELKWSGQGGKDLGLEQMAETLRLTVEQMRALATARVVASRYF